MCQSIRKKRCFRFCNPQCPGATTFKHDFRIGSQMQPIRNLPAVKASLSVGQQVSGVVIARAPFGVWLDIGVAFPALLLVPDMRDARKRRIAFEDYPQKGDSVQGCIKALGDPGKIWITQMNRLYCPKCGGMLETATDGLRVRRGN